MITSSPAVRAPVQGAPAATPPAIIFAVATRAIIGRASGVTAARARRRVGEPSPPTPMGQASDDRRLRRHWPATLMSLAAILLAGSANSPALGESGSTLAAGTIQAAPLSRRDWLRPAPGSAAMAITARARTALTLDAAIAIALARNPVVLRALSEIERQHGVLIVARAAALPRATVGMNLDVIDEYLNPASDVNPAQTLSKGSSGAVALATPGGEPTLLVPPSPKPAPNTDKSPNESWQIELAVTKRLYDGGATRASIAQAEMIEAAAVSDSREVCLDAILAVRQHFYDALFQRGRIVVEEESLRLLEEDLEDQRRRFDAGTVPRFNVLRAEVATYNELPKLIEAKNAYRVALQRLAKLLAIDYAPGGGEEFTPFAPDGELLKTPRSVDLADVVGRALRDRPVLAGLRQRVEAERQGFRIARSGWLPRFDARVSYLFQNDPFWDDIGRTDSGYTAGISGQWDLFDGFATRGRVRQARQQTRSAELEFEDQRRQVELDARIAHSRHIAAVEFMRSQEKNVDLAIEALRLARSRFDSGTGTQLDVLDARVQLTQSALNEVESRFRYQIALADIDRATAAEIGHLKVNSPLPGRNAAPPGIAPEGPPIPPRPRSATRARTPDYRTKPR